MSKTFRWDGKLQIEFLYFESQRVSCEIQKFVTEHQMLSIKMANFQVSDRTLKEHLEVSDERILILKKVNATSSLSCGLKELSHARCYDL